MKNRFKNAISMLLALTMLFCLAACASGITDLPPTNDNQAPDDNTDNSDNDTIPVEDLVYGNEPNNLYQMSNAPCFGDGRIYYINSDSEIMSVALDGSDAKVVGTIGGLTKYSSSPCCLNWYQGSVYYVVVWDRENYDGRYIEIRSMDVSTGAESVVLTCEDNEYNACDCMLIIGDNLFYSCYDVENKNTSINAFNLSTSKQNQIIKKNTGSSPNSSVIASDGRYLYMALGGAGIFRTAWSGIYESEPKCEEVVSKNAYGHTTIFTENGFYSVLSNEDGTRDYVFYLFENSATDWPYETVTENISDGSPASVAEDIAKSLVYYAYDWMIGEAYAAHEEGKVFYSSSADFTQSTAVGELELAYGEILHAGTYDGMLYLIVEGANGMTFHTLTADGNYK